MVTSRITGTGSQFPEFRLTNAELVNRLAKAGQETSDAWIFERTGIRERRISKPGLASEFNSSLAAAAALRALEMAGKTPEQVDQIFYATCTPDTLVPSASCWLQQKIGAFNASGMDINAACSGFVYALAQADANIRAGNSKTCLVIGADVLSSFTNWTDRSSCILFGDGAAAVVVEAAPSQSQSRILSVHTQNDGRLWELFHLPAGGSSLEITPEVIEKNLHKMTMKGREIFKVATRTLADFATKALKANQVSLEELNWFIPHQANLRIIEAVAKRLEFPMEKVLINIETHGNTSSATIPSVLDQAVRAGKIKPGDLILLDAFGAGLTYGAALIRW